MAVVNLINFLWITRSDLKKVKYIRFDEILPESSCLSEKIILFFLLHIKETSFVLYFFQTKSNGFIKIRVADC